VKANNNNIGTNPAKKNTPPNANNVQAKVDIIFNNVCPAIILANNRIDKLKGLNKCDINSITTIKGAINIGVPGGIKKLKKCIPCSKNPMILIPMYNENANPNVTIK